MLLPRSPVDAISNKIAVVSLCVAILSFCGAFLVPEVRLYFGLERRLLTVELPGAQPAASSIPTQSTSAAVTASVPTTQPATPQPEMQPLYVVGLGSISDEEHVSVARALEDATPGLPKDMHIRIFADERRRHFRFALCDPLPRADAEKILQRARELGWKDEVFLTRATGWTRIH